MILSDFYRLNKYGVSLALANPAKFYSAKFVDRVAVDSASVKLDTDEFDLAYEESCGISHLDHFSEQDCDIRDREQFEQLNFMKLRFGPDALF